MPNSKKLEIVSEHMRASRIYINEKSKRSFYRLINLSMDAGNLTYIPQLIDCAESPQEKQELLLYLFEQQAAAYRKNTEFLNILLKYSEVQTIFIDSSFDNSITTACKVAVNYDNIDFVKKILELHPTFNRKLLLDILLLAIEKNSYKITEFILEIKDPEVITNDSEESEQFKKVLRAKALELTSPNVQPLKKENHYCFELLIRHRIPIPKQVLESAVMQADHALVKRLLAPTTVLDYEITDLTIRELLVKAASLNVETLQAVLEGYVTHFAVHLPTALIDMNDCFLGEALEKALFAALESSRIDCVRLLLQHKQVIDFNAVDENGDTFLMVLLGYNCKFDDNIKKELFNYFIQQNVDLTTRNKEGQTIFTLRGGIFFLIHRRESLLVLLIKKLYEQKNIKIDDIVNPKSLMEWVGLNNCCKPGTNLDLENILIMLGIDQRWGVDSTSSNLDIVKFLVACNQEHVKQTFGRYRAQNDYIPLSLLDCSIINNNEVTYQYLRSVGARHSEKSLSNLIALRDLDVLPNYFLQNYFKDNTSKDLSQLLSKAIKTASKCNKPQIISQLLAHCHLIRKVDLIKALQGGFDTNNTAAITALVSNPAITDMLILEAVVFKYYDERAILVILKHHPNIDYFLAEFFIRYHGLNTSHYWHNQPSNKNFCLNDVIQHVRGLHVRKYASGLFTTTYSGRNTRNQLLDIASGWENRDLINYLNHDISNDKKKVVVFNIILKELDSYKRHNGIQYKALEENIFKSLNLRSGSQERPRIISTVNTLKLKFTNINWDKLVEITSWSTTGHQSFFSCGKVTLSLSDYVLQMHNKNREKYIKICSATNETELAEALATHRTGFLGSTTGRQIYDVVKRHDVPPLKTRLDEEHRPEDFKNSAS